MKGLLHIVFFFSIILISCGQNNFLSKAESNKPEIEKAIKYFKGDSLKLDALYFLLENIASQNVELPVIKDGSNSKEIDFTTLPSDSTLNEQLIQNGQQLSIKEIPIIQAIKGDYLISTINLAFNSWKKYPWNRQVSYKEFLHNILPFNINRNYPDNWREAVTEQNKAILDSLVKAGVTKPGDVYKALIQSPLYSQVKYSLKYIRFTNNPSYNEIMHQKKADCFNTACLYVYLLRSAGIPATIDIVPCWGTENGGHSEAVFLNGTGKYAPYNVTRFGHASKVYRYVLSPEPDRIDTSSLDNAIIRQIPAHILDNHLRDVTSSYSHTKDITVNAEGDLAFICVQNFLKWQPVDAGVVKDGSVTFRNMNYHVFYQVAIPEVSGRLKLIDRPFILDENGKQIYKEANISTKQVLELSQVNSFEWNIVRKGQYYALQYLDGQSWKLIEEKQCEADGKLTFENVPVNGMYRLLEHNQERRYLSRCFTCESNKQVWW